jgi:hypothetical protein
VALPRQRDRFEAIRVGANSDAGRSSGERAIMVRYSCHHLLFTNIPGFQKKCNKCVRRVDSKAGMTGEWRISTLAAAVSRIAERAERSDSVDNGIQTGEDFFKIFVC